MRTELVITVVTIAIVTVGIVGGYFCLTQSESQKQLQENQLENQPIQENQKPSEIKPEFYIAKLPEELQGKVEVKYCWRIERSPPEEGWHMIRLTLQIRNLSNQAIKEVSTEEFAKDSQGNVIEYLGTTTTTTNINPRTAEEIPWGGCGGQWLEEWLENHNPEELFVEVTVTSIKFQENQPIQENQKPSEIKPEFYVAKLPEELQGKVELKYKFYLDGIDPRTGLRLPEDSIYWEGKLMNLSTKVLSTITTETTVKDLEGNVIGEPWRSIDYIRLQPGKVWDLSSGCGGQWLREWLENHDPKTIFVEVTVIEVEFT